MMQYGGKRCALNPIFFFNAYMLARIYRSLFFGISNFIHRECIAYVLRIFLKTNFFFENLSYMRK